MASLMRSFGGTLPSMLGTYVTVHEAIAKATTSAASGNKYMFVSGLSDQVTPSLTVNSIAGNVFVRLAAADYTVAGRTTFCRLVVVEASTTQPAQTFVCGLYPVSVSTTTFVAGTVVTGSTVTFTTPGTNNLQALDSGDFAFPADGLFVPGYTVSGTPSAAAYLHCQLQVRVV